MSYPDVGTVYRWVPAGSKDDDPLLINGVPYAVILGDLAGNCTEPCPTQERRNEGLTNEEFLTTVYTFRIRTGFTVVVDADLAISYDQLLYIKDDSVGAVVLTNDVAQALVPVAWGAVFEFASPNNVAPPNNVWLQDGDSGITGCVEAMMLPPTVWPTP